LDGFELGLILGTKIPRLFKHPARNINRMLRNSVRLQAALRDSIGQSPLAGGGAGTPLGCKRLPPTPLSLRSSSVRNT
jgi:hypothetical protein